MPPKHKQQFRPKHTHLFDLRQPPLSHRLTANKNGAPVTLNLSDQCFPPYLEQEPDAAGNCVKVLRVEDGSVGEFAELAMEAFPKGLPINSVILLGSGTRLLRAGTAGYAQAWLAACNKLSRLLSCCAVVPPDACF